MRVLPDLPPQEMRRRLGWARRCEERRGLEVASYLRCIEERRYFTLYGFSSVVAFAAAELGMSTRQVRERIRVAKALDDLPRLGEALRRGKLCFSAVREITRVATPASEASWIRAAARHSVHELERLVASAGPDGTVPPRPTLGLQRNLVKIHLKLLPEEAAKLDVVAARRAAGTGRPPDVRETLLAGLRVLYETEPFLQGNGKAAGTSSSNGVPRKNGTTNGTRVPGERDGPGGLQDPGSRCLAKGNGTTSASGTQNKRGEQAPAGVMTEREGPTARPTWVAVRNRPELVYVMCRSCREGAVATEEGFVATTRQHLEEVEKTARVHDATVVEPDDQRRDVVSTPRVAEVPPEERDVPTPESMRRLVLARDGYRCTVPGCAERAELFAHHVTWRRHGGRTHPDNLVTVCALCRVRHKVHHADSRIMPFRGEQRSIRPSLARGVGVTRSA